MSKCPMATISSQSVQPTSIDPPFPIPQPKPTYYQNSTRIPWLALAYYVTTTVWQPSTNMLSPSTVTINPYSPDRVSQTAFGASLSNTTKPNTTPTHSLLRRHNNNWSNGFTQPPSVPVLALSLMPSNATSSQLGQASPLTSSDTI